MTRTVDYYIERLEIKIAKVKTSDGKNIYGNRSFMGHVMKHLSVDSELQHRAAKRIIEMVINSIMSQSSASNLVMSLGLAVSYVSGYTPDKPPRVATQGIAQMGISILDMLAKEGWISMKKFQIEDSDHQMWHVIPEGDFTSLIISQNTFDGLPSIVEGPIKWEYPVIMHKGHPVELVKRSISSRMWNQYTEDKIPEVYKALNRSNAVSWRVNQHVLDLAIAAHGTDNSFLPISVTPEEVEEAKNAIVMLGWQSAKYKRFILNKVLKDSTLPMEEMLRIAKCKTAEFKLKKGEVALRAVLSSFDKHVTHNKIVAIANDCRYDTLNFLHSLDSRGRQYCVQSYLNYMERDIAKALLQYADEHPVNLQDLAIVTSNIFGNDKVSHEDRITWVNENMDNIRLFGECPWDHMELLESYKLGKKDKWQALALCNVWYRYHIHIENGGNEETFTSPVPCSLDASCQGLQIMSLIMADEVVAPLVNISPNDGDVPGDAYGAVSALLPGALDALPDEKKSETLMAFNEVMKNNPKLARSVSKRNTMTRQYSGTAFGCGKQHIEDIPSYECDEADNLTNSDCMTLGRTLYKLNDTRFPRAIKLMKWLQDGIKLQADSGSIVSWILPDGFVAFCDKPAYKKQSVSGMIGKQRVSLSLLVTSGDKDKSKHRAACAPNIVHSLDAWILREIVRGMPDSAPISSVHDSFSTASAYHAELVELARSAYKSVADRDAFEAMMTECFGKARALPDGGSWEVSELDTTNLFIS